jgi:hypothetical protein
MVMVMEVAVVVVVMVEIVVSNPIADIICRSNPKEPTRTSRH